MLSELHLLGRVLGVVGDDERAALRLLGSLSHRLQHHSNAHAVRLEHLVATPAGLFLRLVHDLLQLVRALLTRLDDISALGEGLLRHHDRTVGAHLEWQHRLVVLGVPPAVLLEHFLVQDALLNRDNLLAIWHRLVHDLTLRIRCGRKLVAYVVGPARSESEQSDTANSNERVCVLGLSSQCGAHGCSMTQMWCLTWEAFFWMS